MRQFKFAGLFTIFGMSLGLLMAMSQTKNHVDIQKEIDRGVKELQDKIESRAWELPDYGYETDCYDWDDVEYIIFGESQE